MSNPLSVLWKYYLPILMLVIALLTLSGAPDEPILKSVPIVPGVYQHEIAAAFAVFGLLLAAIIFRHEKRKAARPPAA